MTETNEAYPLEHPDYEKVRELCAKQTIFDELEFGPLFGEHDDVLAISGSVQVPTGVDEITLSVWRGAREGEATAGELSKLWLRIATKDPAGGEVDEAVPVDPDATDLGLVLPPFFRSAETAEACRILVDLLVAAEPTHIGLTAAARKDNFEHLDEAVQDGFDSAGPVEDYDDGPVDNSELALHMCSANSGFKTISFDLLAVAGYDTFTTFARLETAAGEVGMSAWYDPEPEDEDEDDQGLMLQVGDIAQRMPAAFGDELLVPWSSGIAKEQVRMATQSLKLIHEHALWLYVEATDALNKEVCSALGLVAANAREGGDPLPLDALLPGGSDVHDMHLTGSSWHLQLEEFTRLCRLGLLGSVVVEESPQGPGLNVRAATLDPITHQEIRLQGYWQLNEGSEKPVHMLAAGTATGPAHDGDPMRPELLAGFPQDSREHILHAINHLHDLADVAMDIAAAKDADTAAILVLSTEEREDIDGDAAEIVLGQMQAEALEDALAAMNGIARLYTGSHADREIRNS